MRVDFAELDVLHGAAGTITWRQAPKRGYVLLTYHPDTDGFTRAESQTSQLWGERNFFAVPNEMFVHVH